jgi:hypothetical protein
MNCLFGDGRSLVLVFSEIEAIPNCSLGYVYSRTGVQLVNAFIITTSLSTLGP